MIAQDLGAWHNVTSALGRNPLRWCCPSAPQGTGLHFQLSSMEGELFEFLWPQTHAANEPDFLVLSVIVYQIEFPSSRTDKRHENLGIDVQYSPPDSPSTEKQFQLPSSPWTYDNEGINPNLRPSNSSMLASHGNHAYTSALPPYHPDFDGDSSSRARQSYSPSPSDEDDFQGVRVRRGSEGFEVHSLDREEMLRSYVETELSREGRYQVYKPDLPLDSDDDWLSDDNTRN